MMPGYLHFDCSRGASAPLLVGAMADLLIKSDGVARAFLALGLDDIQIEAQPCAFELRGTAAQFLLRGKPLLAARHDGDDFKHPFIKRCLSADAISLNDLNEQFQNKNLDPRVSALALKIMENLKSNLFVETKLSGIDALWLFCHALTLCVQLRELDPKFVSASPIHVGLDDHSEPSAYLNPQDRLWLGDILRWQPLVEVKGSKPLDVVGAAFIKAVAALTGPRGAFTVMRVGVGLAKNADAPLAVVEASWCEASLPSSIAEIGPSNEARSYPLIEVSGLIAVGSDMPMLVAMLSLHKAQAIHYHLVHGEKNSDFHALRFLISYEHKRDAVEAFLIKAGASQVVLRTVESHELTKRMVNVPLGHGQKSTSARFYEFIYYDKCVRVEPFKDDLEAYVKKTDYSFEVARGDLLMAWKKWRGRIVEDARD